MQYLQTFIDGVDFVFIRCHMFNNLGSNIYGGDREVRFYSRRISSKKINENDSFFSNDIRLMFIIVGHSKTHGFVLQSSC